MPPPGVIIDGLTAIANDNLPLAYLWHAFFFLFVVALIAGWRPSQRTAARLLALPLVSVSLLAWRVGNPFNALVFLALFLMLAALATRLPRARVQIAPAWIVAGGSFLTAFGWAYPHFVRVDHWSGFAYAAPIGLVPCPTLAAMLGISAILQMFRCPRWNTVLAAAGVVYGVIGVFRLGVSLDYGLLAGALFLVSLQYLNAYCSLTSNWFESKLHRSSTSRTLWL